MKQEVAKISKKWIIRQKAASSRRFQFMTPSQLRCAMAESGTDEQRRHNLMKLLKYLNQWGVFKQQHLLNFPYLKKRDSFQLFFFFFSHLVERQRQRARHVNLRVFLPACMSQTVRLEKGI